MTDPSGVAINWNPQPPPNRKRWEAEIRSALSATTGTADVEMLEVGGSWRVQSATVGAADVRHDVTEYLVAMGFPVLGLT